MAVVEDIVGVSAGESGATGSIVRLELVAGSSSGTAVGSSNVTLISAVIGRSDGLGSSTGAIIRMSVPYGTAAGEANAVASLIEKFSVLIGSAAGVSSVQAYAVDRNLSEDMSNLLPIIFQESKAIRSIQAAQGTEATRIVALLEQRLRDYFVDTASEDELNQLEKDLGLSRRDKSDIQRREAIKKRKKRPDVLTKQIFKETLEDYYVCKIHELKEDHRVVSTILSKRGIPEDLAEAEDLIERVLPAHLLHEFEFTWLPWREFKEAGFTWNQAKKFKWGELQTSFLVPFDESDY